MHRPRQLARHGHRCAGVADGCERARPPLLTRRSPLRLAGDHTKLDNMVQVGHNVRVGRVNIDTDDGLRRVVRGGPDVT